MATQHPDNAGKPFWHSKPFISTSAEITESFICFSDLGIDEYNWDWEGKFVDEAVADRLLHKHYVYFKKHPLGKEKFLTFRIPNPRVEKQFRLARAFMVMITSSQLAKSLGFENPPIFETILPLTETAHEVIEIQRAYRDLVSIEHRLLQMNDSLKHIEIIPLFEQVSKILDSANLIKSYIRLHKDSFKEKPQYLRPYCARSDPALNSGLIPTMLALKVALSSYKKVEEETQVKLFPMVGTGSLPFRGSVVPDEIDKSIEEYAGIKTLILQSAFRYDYPLSKVKQAVIEIKNKLPHKKPLPVTSEQVEIIKKIIPYFEKPYQETIEYLSPLINQIARQVPRRRERVQHVGLFGYSRGMGKITLPRAITFTAALYSLGIPPELIGTGIGIHKAKKRGVWKEISYLYKNVKHDLVKAGYYLNRENIQNIDNRGKLSSTILENIKYIEEELQVEFGPKQQIHMEHKKLTDKIFERIREKKNISPLITLSGVLRKSLG
jgi:phosphoenolpyruvate carboxylase